MNFPELSMLRVSKEIICEARIVIVLFLVPVISTIKEADTECGKMIDRQHYGLL
jgi:hypothetical protein